MRVYALYVVIAFLSLYAYRNWFRSLCGLIVLVSVIAHPDMPHNMMNIQGLNPWNILFANVVLGWFLSRRREGLKWDMPRAVNRLLIAYALVILVATIRLLFDRTNLEGFSTANLVGEALINTFKWPLVGLLVFDGCRSRERRILAVVAVLAVYFLLAVQVVKWMPISEALSGAALGTRSLKVIERGIGYSRVNMSMILAGASWAILAAIPLVKATRYKVLVAAAALTTVFAQALTGGRMGYVTWGAVGMIMCVVKWRKLLPFAPLVPIIIVLLVPGVAERMLEGHGAVDAAGQTYVDDYSATAGRTMIWPHVIDKIAESPVVGYGREAMRRSGLASFLMVGFNEGFSHPHNMYLECLLDSGILGLICILPFYGYVLLTACRLFVDRRDPWRAATGGIVVALVLALLVAGAGSQTFYPREGALGMWVAIGIMLRVFCDTNPKRNRGFVRGQVVSRRGGFQRPMR